MVWRVRVLFTTVAGVGHCSPMVPLAQALVGAGHDVAVATTASFAETVQGAGLELVPVGLAGAGFDHADPIGGVIAEHPEARSMPRAELIRWLVVEFFAKRLAAALLADRERLLDWRPDLVVREEDEFGGPALAALACRG
jgi:hypothetical protein